MNWPLQCPAPASGGASITLAQGEGGRLSRKLLSEVIFPALGPAALGSLDDAAVLPLLSGAPVMTTDSFIVSPLFFPGGDIGSLAVYGSVNDLAVAGARPRWLSLSLILEEGLPLETLHRILTSIRQAAERSGVLIAAGDTKVAPRGAVDQIFITTTGVGELLAPAPPGPLSLEVGDEIVVTGPIGRHGVAILAAREQLGFDPPPKSDCSDLFPAAEALRSAGVAVKAMRDATRGGLAAVLQEWAAASQRSIELEEAAIPVSSEVRGVCELLGLDPLHMACEGTMAVATAPGAGNAAVAALRSSTLGSQAALIGRVAPPTAAPVVIRRMLGGKQPLDDPAGRPLPRIC